MIHAEALASDGHEAGIYTWVLDRNRMYGDTTVAELFGLDPLKTLAGLPLEDYFDQVHEMDREPLAQAICDAVRNGDPYHAGYRVRNIRGEYSQVVAVGRCFRDDHQNPSIYSGIIYPVGVL